MTSLFIVTSAIHTSYGKCSTEERIEQTRKTIESIRERIQDPVIKIIDCGEKSVDSNLFDCDIIDYTSNERIKKYLNEYLNNTRDLEPDIIIKSMLEIMMFGDYLKTTNLSKYSRVFKISGRYRLNDRFDYEKHLESKNKVLILFPRKSQHFYNLSVNVSMFQYMTRFWSFDISILDKIINTYSKMEDEIIYISKKEKQGDIEHLLYKHLDKRLVDHIEKIGIEGYWAPLKIWIEE